MKSMIKPVLLLLLFAGAVSSCRKDYIGGPTFNPDAPVSFNTQVLPIFTSSCALANCHVTGGHQPDLTAPNAYNSLIGLGYVDTTDAAGSKLYEKITATTKPMPPDGKLSSNNINLILAWIKQGAQNN